MKPADVLRELLYPLTDMAIVMAMIFFWLMFALVKKAGLIGLWLLVLLAPAYFRYLLYLLESRANAKQAPVPTAEMFSPTASLWTLTPFILLSLLIWTGIALEGTRFEWFSALIALLIIIVVPASLGILAITHSPEESLNPAAIVRMIRICGPTYILVPVFAIVISLGLVALWAVGMPLFLIDLGNVYLTIMLFTFTGSILHMSGVAFDIKIDAPLEATEDEIAGDLERERQNIADHAYGFISRGNRDGGFAHILNWIEKEADIDEASAWFFAAMMKWEAKDAALFYAQIYLAHLLHHERDARALKLMSTCLHQDPLWKPKMDDRPQALALAEKYGRDDLLRSLRD